MTLGMLKCEWCSKSDVCRFQWIDDTDYPRPFCSIVCMMDHIFWGRAQDRAAQLRQDKTETVQALEKIGNEHEKRRTLPVEDVE
jgi:hypothetical protein